MLKNWWKILSAILIIYVTIAGLSIPMNPGVIEVATVSSDGFSQTIEVVGYNTHFKSNEASLQAFAKSGDLVICGDIDQIISESRLTTIFDFSGDLPSNSIDIYVNDNEDGTVYLPNAIRLESTGDGFIKECKLTVSSNDHQNFGFPFQTTLFETIRNLMFHVPMWFTMFFLMILSIIFSTRNLMTGNPLDDIRAFQAVRVGLLFCILGLITGSIWARFTWGGWWTNDPQLNGALVTFLIYVAYIILRNSIDDEEKRARISGIYNIFAFAMLVTLLMILPRFTESLHPGKSGNPAFSSYDLDSSLRLVFYPAVIGWILVGYWMYKLNFRLGRIQRQLHYDE